MLTYVNINMKNNMTMYGARFCLKLMLNRLKEMRDSISFTPLWGPSSRKFPNRLLCVHQVKKLLENLPN